MEYKNYTEMRFCMLKISLVVVVMLVSIVLCGYAFFCAVSFYGKRNSAFDSKLTAVFHVDCNEENTEIVLRELISYIRRNELNCFRKIYLKVDADNENIKRICCKLSREYPLFKVSEDE
jgi:hypothetical protein